MILRVKNHLVHVKINEKFTEDSFTRTHLERNEYTDPIFGLTSGSILRL